MKSNMPLEQSYQQYSYESSFGAVDDGLAFQDFLPNCQKPHGTFSKGEYDSFRVLLDRANDWLRGHPEVEIKTCETVEFKSRHNEIDPQKMVYLEEGRGGRWFIRGLRLWYRRCDKGGESIRQIGYRDLVPTQKEEGGQRCLTISPAVYEDLDEVILRYNNAHRTDPIPGQIITIESQSMRVGTDGEVDTDCSSWSEGSGVYRVNYLFILRIYFEVTDPKYEEIGVKDFIPECISKSCMTFLRKYEPFSKVIESASDWCLQQSHLRICNFQSLNTKLQESGSGPEVDTKKTSYSEDIRCATFYVRTLRIGYVKRQSDDSEELDCESRPTSKCFAPVLLKTKRCYCCCITNSTMPDFESLQETQKRISTWLNKTGADILNVETLALRLDSNGAQYSCDLSFSCNPQDQNEFWFHAIRLYLIGSYIEPTEDTLPPLPEVQTEGCIIL